MIKDRNGALATALITGLAATGSVRGGERLYADVDVDAPVSIAAAEAGVDYRMVAGALEGASLLHRPSAHEVSLGMLRQDDAGGGSGSIEDHPDFVPEEGWVGFIQPYIWLPVRMSVTSTVAGLSVSADATISDVFDSFNLFAISGRIEAYHGRVGFMTDGLYVRLRSRDDAFVAAISSVDIDQAIVDLALAWQVLDVPLGADEGGPHLALTLFGGGRYFYLNQTVNLSSLLPVPPLSLGGSESWFEPLIQGRLTLFVNDWLALSARADASGFGVGSGTDLTWNVQAGGAIRLGERWTLFLAYRYMDMDYDVKAPRFGLQVQMHGPYIGMGWRF